MSTYGKTLGTDEKPFGRLGRIACDELFMREALAPESYAREAMRLIMQRVLPLRCQYDMVTGKFNYIVASYGDDFAEVEPGKAIPFYNVEIHLAKGEVTSVSFTPRAESHWDELS